MTGSRALVIVGAGGHGKVVLDAARAGGWQVAGFLDSVNPAGTRILDAPVLGNEAGLTDPALLAQYAVIVAIGDQTARRRLCLNVLAAGGTLAMVRHPASVVSPSVRIGAGSFLAAGVIVNPDAHIGQYCILNTGCTIDHDCRLADGTQVSPGAHLAGSVTCGDDVFIGTGAAIIPRITIGSHAVVGAGAVVIRDVEAGTRVAGNPARTIRGGNNHARRPDH
jgi:sugar O-acyltransferase (sialic acid O-acetyltransferase NeuD family)